eukprot:TRINITY_DN24554_c0_g1_i2.p1 TRINITY_DN24554_c0_g1~~TRINITY_DN24554_c0_g1_i2.p1  ORF type:complete len:138 (-),score=19.23 TRINITY_DN24554_c0_g1_i2:66-479(-)
MCGWSDESKPTTMFASQAKFRAELFERFAFRKHELVGACMRLREVRSCWVSGDVELGLEHLGSTNRERTRACRELEHFHPERVVAVGHDLPEPLHLARALLSLIHISEPTRLLSISYAVFCLKKKKKTQRILLNAKS